MEINYTPLIIVSQLLNSKTEWYISTSQLLVVKKRTSSIFTITSSFLMVQGKEFQSLKGLMLKSQELVIDHVAF